MNDIETSKETSLKVHKLPTESHDQTALSKQIETLWEQCAAKLDISLAQAANAKVDLMQLRMAFDN